MPVAVSAPAAGRAPTAAAPVRALVCDWAGVLTNPVAEILAAYCRASGISASRIGEALARVAAADGADPFAELECGRLSEVAFLHRVGRALSADGTGGPADVADFRATWFAGIRPNEVLLSYLRDLRERGLVLALLTNNVREWEPLWRATLPAGLFDLEVSSSAERVRKPDPAIYARTRERLALPAGACLLVDDVPENCAAAEACGMRAILFRSTSQAIAAIEERVSP